MDEELDIDAIEEDALPQNIQEANLLLNFANNPINFATQNLINATVMLAQENQMPPDYVSSTSRTSTSSSTSSLLVSPSHGVLPSTGGDDPPDAPSRETRFAYSGGGAGPSFRFDR